MPGEVSTCPKCGALITPQLSRCRQCKTYLHGTNAEGWLFDHILPERLRGSPGTGLILLMLFAYYVMMAVFARTPLSFSSFSLQQLGAMFGPWIELGEYWRFVTANLIHHDLIHLAFNTSALLVLGPLIEQAFDRKKMLIIFVITGVISMMVSYLYHTRIAGLLPFTDNGTFVTSGGASGAICGLLGACWYAAHKMGPAGRDVAHVMKRWAILILLMGLVLPVDNGAHIGGGLAGAALAAVIPMGMTKTNRAQRILSVFMFTMFAGVAGCVGLMLTNLAGSPAFLVDDAQPNSFFLFTISPGKPYKFSSQWMLTQACSDAAIKPEPDPDARAKCELALRANPGYSPLYGLVAGLCERDGETERAAALRALVARLTRMQALGRGDHAHLAARDPLPDHGQATRAHAASPLY
ncbi:MAG: rhomboid family intramembrane serine protease [Deltaproteobacteria bacterium]|nr:rhomboid family intramembrane serine protease [Deltaproteobacteria bacterium]